MTPITIVQGQLDAYNNQDLELFLSFFSDAIEVYSFPNKLIYTGIHKMRDYYKNAWELNPKQKAIVNERMFLDKTVIDKELVVGRANGIELNVIAMYTIENNTISKVFFIRE
ncbi:nuclear transport factor 2 family protein [Flavobacterium laiguense]|uniref:Steroid delta-isomerase n=1 Tax=Flavobacterium laiguense TaxID=2169409 RepID=A0A2U1JSF2_9FLAO|nr:steroid delta-isomerase [Flavobacterium laiguense]PWA07889.1 steroid delta-isomerase [Flavobacterium laiguense]